MALSVQLVHQEGYMTVFVDEGETTLRLLRLLVARFGATNYSPKLISAFAAGQNCGCVERPRVGGLDGVVENRPIL